MSRAWRPGALALLSTLPEAAALLDDAGVLIGWNEPCRMLLGPALAGAPTSTAADWFQPDRRTEFRALLAARQGRLGLRLADPIAAPRVIEAEVISVGPDMLLLRLTPPPAPRGDERLALVGRMAGGVAHDFNNLLGIVTGSVDAARRLGAEGALLEELAALEAVATRGAALVRQLLAFSRQQVLAPRVMALNERVAEAGALLPRLIGQDAELEVVLAPQGRLVLVDPSQLDQVIVNLVVNARDALVRAGRPKGQLGRIRLATGNRLVLRAGGEGPGAVPPGRYATLTVEDDGPGIPPDILPRIFEPFFTTRIEQGGTGLGLATVQGIVAQSGGFVTAECPASGGTRFTILLPRHDGALPEALPPPPWSQAPPSLVMLVEDEPALLRLGTQALRGAGHEVLPAEDGYAAMELLEAGSRPAVLVSDVSMPGMDGLALAQAARALIPGLPILLLSGYAAATLSVDLAAAQLGFLAKPFGGDALVDGVAQAIQQQPLAKAPLPEHIRNIGD